jgi:PqqD family protein of HPr-rel-A system
MKADPAPAHAAEAVTIDFDGETLVYHRVTGEVHRLDPVGSIVWRVLDGRTTVDELATDLSASFGVDPIVVRADVADLLERLRRVFLLADGPPPEPPVEPVLLANPPSP